MSQLEIQAALYKRLETVPGLPTIYPGAVFKTPSRGTNFVNPILQPIESAGLLLSGKQDNSGFYAIRCFTTIAQGEGPLITIMDAIKDHFKTTTTLTEGSTTVFVTTVTIEEILQTDTWLQGNVLIKYKQIEE